MMIQYLRTQTAPFVLHRRAPSSLDDQAEHAAAYRADPRRYALALLAEGVQPGQRARGLLQLLAGSRAGLSEAERAICDGVIEVLTAGMPADEVLRVFLAAKRGRVNNKHTRRAILRWIFDHPALEEMAARRRPSLVECIEHAAGVDVARACAKQLAGDASDIGEAYVRRNLLRFASNPERARSVIPALFRRAELPPATAADYTAARLPFEPPRAEPPKTVTATNRGDIAATLVHIYRGGTDPELSMALEHFIDEAAAQVPRFAGKVALVLDASASTAGYGDREFCCIAQSVALRLVLERCVRELAVVTVGGEGGAIPQPRGATDLAMGVLDALAGEPDVVVVITDGYESCYPGDLAAVVDALPGAGIDIPVVMVLSTFTWKDDLTLRQPAQGAANLAMWHQDDFRRVALTAFGLARGEAGEDFMNHYLEQRLLELALTREVGKDNIDARQAARPNDD